MPSSPVVRPSSGRALAAAALLAPLTLIGGVGALGGTAEAAVPAGCTERGPRVICVFDRPSATAVPFRVPRGVSAVTIEAQGASGGTGGGGDAHPGGLGGISRATMGVPPGDTLFLLVGERGKDAVQVPAPLISPDLSVHVGDGVEGSDPGGEALGGGARGGRRALADPEDNAGGGGGGGSFVLTENASPTEATPLVAAGGGGGSGGSGPGGPGLPGGHGGGEAGANGPSGNESNSVVPGGGGGSRTAPGYDGGLNSEQGHQGIGGHGADAIDTEFQGAGGGGGGYLGGGGGTSARSFAGGGGGGSGYIRGLPAAPLGENTFGVATAPGDGRITISWTTTRARCGSAVATVVGTGGADTLIGTDGRDVIAGLGGNDLVAGTDGSDLICAGPGDDFVSAGAGNDRVLAGPGRDDLRGGGGSDVLDGGAGDDRGYGGPGPERFVAVERRFR